ncbi:MAG: ComEC/Rec2 family competence protein [Friedmanniella sp.]
MTRRRLVALQLARLLRRREGGSGDATASGRNLQVGDLQVRDLRVVPLAAAAWAAAWWATGAPALVPPTSAGPGLVLVLAGAAVTGLVLACSRLPPLRRLLARQLPWLAATALVVVAVGTGGALRVHGLRTGPVAELAQQQAVVSARFEVRSDPQLYPARGGRPPLLALDVRLTEVSGRGHSWRIRAPVTVLVTGATTASWRSLPVGTTVQAGGRLRPAESGDAVAAVLRGQKNPEVLEQPGPGSRRVERVRQGLRDAVADRRPDARALVPALVLGDTSALPADLKDDFRTTGLTHLTAVSGANLTLLLAFLLLTARWAGVRGWALRGVGPVGVAIFVALCRTEPSVLRAAAMGLVALAALGSGARAAGIRNLGVAVLVLLLADPFLSRSWGFALSVLASGGIIWWARSWADVLSRWLPRLVAETVTLALAAHLATLPAVALLSGTVSMAGLATNAVVGPFVGPATVLGFAAAGSSLVSAELAALLGFGAAWSAQPIITVARFGAALPGASLIGPTSPVAVTVLAVCCLATALAMPWVLARRWLCALLTLALVVALSRAPTPPGWPPAGWRLVVCDVGQGDGLALSVGPHAAVVVDSGPDPALMRRCLDGLAVRRVPLLVLTHYHADHVGGVAAVFAGRTVDQLWVSPLAEPAGEAAAVRRLAAEHGSSVAVPLPGTRVGVGAATLDVLGPLPAHEADADSSAEQNDASLVVRADLDGLRVLLPGDVEPPGQQALLDAGADLRVSVLKVPHHGSSRQQSAFFAATGASLAVASAGLQNDYGHPAPRMLALARSLGMTVLRTDQNGSVAVTGRDGELRVVAQRPP